MGHGVKLHAFFVSNSKMQVNMECYGDINEDYFSKFGLYSGKSLENAPSPSGGWFTFSPFQ